MGAKVLALMAPDIENILVMQLTEKCSSCQHYEECTIRASSKKVVIQCELFEDRQEAFMEHDELPQTTGLCVSCNKRHFCFLPKDAAGVWHCEGYE